MNRIRPGRGGDIEDPVCPQVRLAARCRADADRFPRHPHMQRGPVRFREDGDGVKATLMTASDDADGDLTPIGDEDLADGPAGLR